MVGENDSIVLEIAGCLLFDAQGRILLLHRNANPSQWEIPGGKVMTNESYAEAAQREVLEELGVTVQISRYIGKCTFQMGQTDAIYYWFSANIVGGKTQLIEKDKFDKFDYLSMDFVALNAHEMSQSVNRLLSQYLNKAISLL